ncbi:MAG: type II toxin-antitoxin system death-on-curing family toxin [Clostridiales bacterium]|nr:type II toxin-antitoxin system death-on-curing family toxin [Clostridiales bacterium]
MIRFSKQQILLLHEQLISETGGEYGLRDENLLDSAVCTPFQTFDGIDLYPTICEKGARLGYGLIKNHPFVDGNKRIGTHAMLLFFEINGISLCYTQDELSDFILKIASDEKQYKDLINWILKHKIE